MTQPSYCMATKRETMMLWLLLLCNQLHIHNQVKAFVLQPFHHLRRVTFTSIHAPTPSLHREHQSVVNSQPTTKLRYRLSDDDEEGSVHKRSLWSTLKKKQMLRMPRLFHKMSSSSLSQKPMFYGNKTVKSSIPAPKIRSLAELRHAILNEKHSLKDLDISLPSPTTEAASLNATSPSLSHPVLSLLRNRTSSKSVPSRRHPRDRSHLALSIEGGGMRGAVSAGMSAAIALLGLTDGFDSIYGSSAGSVIGSYMVSRQMCMDVYTDILPKAKNRFVSKARIMGGIVVSALLVGKNNSNGSAGRNKGSKESVLPPGMNISFVLDGILNETSGLRPLDIDSFRRNNEMQPLQVVSSVVTQDKRLQTVVFNASNADFYPLNDDVDDSTRSPSRKGLFACLQASMTVPGATGPPVPLFRGNGSVISAFDAFCFEPLPYRSAVDNGATHVLVLRSRPEGCEIKTKPGLYETTVAPLYFRQHGEEEVARYFERGGQQYRYLEDVLTLEEGARWRGGEEGGVPVPPPDLYYGVDDALRGRGERFVNPSSDWKRAHLLPCVVPRHKPELSNLEQGEDEVLEAVRGGFAAAFDLLAPCVPSLEMELEQFGGNLTGDRVAELVFPKETLGQEGLSSTGYTTRDSITDEGGEVKTIAVQGDLIEGTDGSNMEGWFNRQYNWNNDDSMTNSTVQRPLFPSGNTRSNLLDQQDHYHAQTLLSCLPGIQSGKLSHLARGLYNVVHRRQ
eukprot:CAMPEP_0172504948 /NCGR_PEP_ID=MMETSP1066-20121228/182428_1 /TAXON_ID=671091 /ORGANISM="Coscinodiscus wailesii, Strain CCMP2513" /LENGTH=733 /DNA_ID=CAMNT_0013281357 /DNA_START=41 /DNA_END=2242 /DNA_ORIENTATION=+